VNCPDKVETIQVLFSVNLAAFSVNFNPGYVAKSIKPISKKLMIKNL
jgi:hypothetical protein